MSLLNEYIEEVKKKTKGLTENEVVRYVYLDLGRKFSFDLKWAYGNNETRKQIYAKSSLSESLDETMKNSIGICKSFSYIVANVLNSMDKGKASIRILTDDDRINPHVYNIIIPSEGEKYLADLQVDLMNIQGHFRTEYFGLSLEKENETVISRDELERMDKKLGYIDSEHYYADEYIDLIKSVTDGIDDIKSKVEVALLNIEPYINLDREYAETKWLHNKLYKKIFSDEERNKIKMIDCYRNVKSGRDYQLLIVVEKGKIPDYYMYSKENGRYLKISIEQLEKNIKEGLIPSKGIPGMNYWRKNNIKKDFDR